MHADQRAARIFGGLFILTFVTSIAGLLLYGPVLGEEGDRRDQPAVDRDAQPGLGGRSGRAARAGRGARRRPRVDVPVRPRLGAATDVLVAPEILWEAGLGLYALVKGFRTPAVPLAGGLPLGARAVPATAG